MDVSIAVTLIRGQMGAVVERAVNVAVETVLAEMLKVVGAKFEELKAELALAKRGAAALQREAALREKENDNVRARLRYTELKLKYYRQGVEEELQQRACAAFRGPPEREASHRKDGDQQGQFSWTAAVLPPPEAPDATGDPSRGAADEAKPPPTGSLPPDACDQTNCSMLPPTAPKVKLEALSEPEELITIKEEPEEEEEEEEEEEQVVMASLLLDSQLPGSETHRSLSQWTKLSANQTSQSAAFSSSSQSSCGFPYGSDPQLPPPAALPSGPLPWTKELSLYEEYKLRRNELRRRNLNRRKELEKTLPQPLLADLIRERREKTRLRVARWRAKRKLQVCLSQVQAQGGAAVLSQAGFPVGGQQLRAGGLSPVAQQKADSAAPPTQLFLNSMNSSVASILTFLPSSSSSSCAPSCSTSLQASSMAPPEHSLTSCFPPSSQSQQGTSPSEFPE